MNLCPWSSRVHRLFPVWLTEKKAYANWAIWRNIGLQPNMVMMVCITRLRCTSDGKWVPSGATLNLWHTYFVSFHEDIMNLNSSHYPDSVNFAIEMFEASVQNQGRYHIICETYISLSDRRSPKVDKTGRQRDRYGASNVLWLWARIYALTVIYLRSADTTLPHREAAYMCGYIFVSCSRPPVIKTGTQ